MWNPNQGTPYGQPGIPAYTPQQWPYPGQCPPSTNPYPGYPGPAQQLPVGGYAPPPPPLQPGQYGYGGPGCPPQYPVGYPGGYNPNVVHYVHHKHHGHCHCHCHGHGLGLGIFRRHHDCGCCSSDSD